MTQTIHSQKSENDVEMIETDGTTHLIGFIKIMASVHLIESIFVFLVFRGCRQSKRLAC